MSSCKKLAYYLLTLSFLYVCLAPINAQEDEEETPEQLFEDGDYFFAREEYSEAAYLYSQLLRVEPDNANVHYKIGMTYLEIEGEEDKAIHHFLEATKDITLKYRKNYYPEKQAPYHTWFFLGNAYRIDNQLDKALEVYDKFRGLKDFEKKYNPRITEEEIKAVGRAKIIQDAPLDIYKFCFEEPINTGGIEYNAVISADENVLVWMNSQKFYEAILMSVKQDGKWSNPINITPQVGSDGEMIPSGLSADGKKLLLVKHGTFDSDIYISEYDGTFWTKAEPIPGNINSNFTEDHASFFPDGNKIILSSDRRGSYGGLDLWLSEKQADGSWGDPENMGEVVNTEYDETSAYVSPDAKVLIFSSKGHFNMGGFDIFQTDINEDGSLDYAFNIGYPINTTNDNTYFVPVKDGHSGIYSIRDPEGVGGKDIWFIEIIPHEQVVAKALTRLSDKDFSIIITDKESGEKIKLEYDSVNDKITISSESGKEYGVVYSREK